MATPAVQPFGVSHMPAIRAAAETARQTIEDAFVAEQFDESRRLEFYDAVVGHLTAAYLAARAGRLERADGAVSQFVLFLRVQVRTFLAERRA